MLNQTVVGQKFITKCGILLSVILSQKTKIQAIQVAVRQAITTQEGASKRTGGTGAVGNTTNLENAKSGTAISTTDAVPAGIIHMGQKIVIKGKGGITLPTSLQEGNNST